MPYNTYSRPRPSALMPVNKQALQTIAAIEGEQFNELVARQHYLMAVDKNGNPNLYIRKAGLLRKMEQKYGKNWVVQPSFPSEEEYNRLIKWMGVQEGTPCVIIKAELFVDGKDRPYVSYSHATPENTKNGRLLEMAETRAISRVIKLATNCGFTGVEELEEKLTLEELKEEQGVKEPIQPGPELEAIRQVFKNNCKQAGLRWGKNVVEFIHQELQRGNRLAGRSFTRPKDLGQLTIQDYHYLNEILIKSITEIDEVIVADDKNSKTLACSNCYCDIDEATAKASSNATGGMYFCEKCLAEKELK